jgi:hypothetical protein
MVPINQNKDVSCRIGITEGEFNVPENIDGANEEVAKLFYGFANNNASQGIHKP